MFLSGLLAVSLAFAGTVTVDMLDIGQGDAILVRTPAGKTILIDAGDGKISTVEQLRAVGIDHIDLLVASHPHADHIGGMDEVVEAFPVKVFIDNGLTHTTQTYTRLMTGIEAHGIAYKTALTGTVFTLDDGATLDVLFPTGTPLRDTRSDLNSNSVVVRLVHGDDCFLFTGDSEEPTEQALLAAGIAQCDVLKVAHHGSNHSTTSAFLAAVDPDIALISVGTGNTYGHPGDETMGRLHDAGVTIYRTDLDGQITVKSDGHGVKVTTAKKADGTVAAGDPVQYERPTVGSEKALISVQPVAPVPAVATPAAPSTNTPPASTERAAANGCTFVASKSSQVFHDAECGNGARIGPQNQVCYLTREAALADGKRPAQCCDP